MKATLWPRCPKCNRRFDLRSKGTTLIAQCCGFSTEVQLAFVPVGAEINLVELAPAQHRKDAKRSRR